jgi:hypothetical protein
MLVATERPTARQIAGHAWKSLFQAAGHSAPLFLGSLALLVLINTRSVWLPGYQAWASQLPGGPPGLANALIITTAEFFGLILLAPLAVAIHRFVLLGEKCKNPILFNRTSLRFAALLVLFELAKLAGALVQLRISTVAGILYQIGCFIVICWTLLVFPSIAVEETTANGLFRTAAARAQGNSWLIARALLLTVYPLAVVWAVLLLAYRFSLMALLRSGIPQSLLSCCYVLINNCFKIALIGLGAATASWLYSYAAHRPAQPEISSACLSGHGANE